MSVIRRTSWYFLSSLGVPVLSLITLPLFTTRLGPEQYGAFALATSIASIIPATAGSVSMVNLPTVLPQCSKTDRCPYISAVLCIAFITAILSAILVYSLYTLSVTLFHTQLLSVKAIIISALSAIVNTSWVACTEILSIEGRAKSYALTTFLQAIANILVITAALFIGNDVEYALFWGNLGMAATGLAGTIVIFASSFTLRGLRPWMPIARKGAVASIGSSLCETGKTAIERAYLGSLVGIAPLGLLAHAQYYKNATMAALNALSRGVWPKALSEAQEDIPSFPITLSLWKLVQGFVLAVTLTFALIGQEIIGLLTHNKFIGATTYAVALLWILLLQTAAKPHITLLMSRAHGHINAYISTISILISLAWLLISVPFIGIWGAISAFFLQTIIHRVYVYKAAHRLHRIGFTDGWIAVGTLMTGVCLIANFFLMLHLVWRIVLLAILYIVVLVTLYPKLKIFSKHA